MSLADFLTSWTAIVSAAFLSATFMYLFLFKFKEILDWEAEHIWKRIFLKRP